MRNRAERFLGLCTSLLGGHLPHVADRYPFRRRAAASRGLVLDGVGHAAGFSDSQDEAKVDGIEDGAIHRLGSERVDEALRDLRFHVWGAPGALPWIKLWGATEYAIGSALI